jgi:hypothetical protein
MVPSHWRECPGNEFCRIQQYIQNVFANPEVFQEEAKIFVYARNYSGGKPNLNNSVYQSFKDNHFPLMLNESRYTANIPGDNSIVIFDFSDGQFPNTLELLREELNAEVIPESEAPKNVQINREDISIIIKGD